MPKRLARGPLLRWPVRLLRFIRAFQEEVAERVLVETGCILAAAIDEGCEFGLPFVTLELSATGLSLLFENKIQYTMEFDIKIVYCCRCEEHYERGLFL